MRLSVSTIPAIGQRVSGKSVSVTPERTFAVNGLRPGKLMISPNLSQLGESMPFILSSIAVSGVVQKEPIELKAGDQISDLLLVFTYASASLRGTIKFATGEIPPRSKGTATLYRDQTFIKWGALDDRGQFLLESLPAGTYRLVVSLEAPGAQARRAEQVVNLTNAQVAETVVILPDQ